MRKGKEDKYQSAIGERFGRLREKGRRALIPFFTAGFPSPEVFREFLLVAQESGADIIEVGVPFSDPLADGPSIQHSSGVALSNGVTLRGILEDLRKRPASDIPLVIMTYVNPLLAWEWRGFAEQVARSRVAGVIVPDLPLEESSELEKALAREGVDLIYLATPTTPGPRLKELGDRTRGFLYLVTVTGVTGARDSFPPELPEFIEKARRETDLPLCLGFGISRGEQATEVGHLADGVIVGSALIQRIVQAENDAAALTGVRELLIELRRGLDRVTEVAPKSGSRRVQP